MEENHIKKPPKNKPDGRYFYLQNSTVKELLEYASIMNLKPTSAINSIILSKVSEIKNEDNSTEKMMKNIVNLSQKIDRLQLVFEAVCLELIESSACIKEASKKLPNIEEIALDNRNKFRELFKQL